MARFLLGSVLVIASASFAERPKLGVVIVVDQLSAEAFEARLPKVSGGFKRMLDQGARYRDLRFEAAPTITSAGHATIMTGTYPASHGIVSNEWVDWKTGKGVLSTEDHAYRTLDRPAAKQDGTAPTHLRVPTLGDALKAADARAKVVAISGKDRSGILLAGRSADAAVWFDSERPIFTTSTFYAATVPDFVTPTNQALGAALLKKLFAWGLPGGGTTGANPIPQGRHGDSEPDAEQPVLQPMLDAWEVELALAAVKSLKLGADEVPDLLAISFSGHDRIGHGFGAESPESLAEFLAVDRELGRLFDGLDRQVGKGAWVAMLTSDHGVAPVPEAMVARRLDAGRIDLKKLREVLEQEADARLGPGDWFAGNKTPGITATAQGREKVMAMAEALRAVAVQQPGVLDLLPGPQLEAGVLGPAAEVWRRGYVAGRSPDFTVVSKPYWIYSKKDVTGHASQWLYDRSVPALFVGQGVGKGTFERAEAIDLAPTFARLLQIAPPAGSQGAVLTSIFATEVSPPGRTP